MSKTYTVQPGDNLKKIARAHGFNSWREIYDHPENEPFRRRRPNPSLIHPGDQLVIPDRPMVRPPPEGVDIPRYLRLPWNYASQLHLPRLVPLSPGRWTQPQFNSGGSSLFDFQSINLSNPAGSIPTTNPGLYSSRFGTGRPRPSRSCGPWGCARGRFDLDQPRVGTMGNVFSALMSVPWVNQRLGDVGDYLWTNAPSGRRAAVGTAGGVLLVGGVTSFIMWDDFRTTTLDLLNGVDIPIGAGILKIPGVGDSDLAQTVFRPLKFQLIWQDPSRGGSEGFMGQGGILILEFKDPQNN